MFSSNFNPFKNTDNPTQQQQSSSSVGVYTDLANYIGFTYIIHVIIQYFV